LICHQLEGGGDGGKLVFGNGDMIIEDGVIALDEEEGTYGGHKVLVPLTIAEGIC
jgi:hypothetical protein